MNVDEMPAGIELDVLVAKRAMGWTKVHQMDSGSFCGVPPQGAPPYVLPHYSTDIAAAWKVAQVLNQGGYTLRLAGPEIPDTTGCLIEKSWSAAFVEPQYAFTKVGQGQGRGSTPSLAICRAALKVMEDE